MEWLSAQRQAAHRFFREQYGRFVRTTAIVFIALILLTFAAGMLLPRQAEAIVDMFSRFMYESAVLDTDGSVQAAALFLSNLRAVALGVLYGLIPFLFLPALPLGINAMVIGLFASYYVQNGMSLLTFLAGVLPHGIFELPALVLGIALGLCLCRGLTDYVRKNTKGVMVPLFLNLARVFLLWIVPLLAVAAIIETYITPVILQWFI